MCIQLDTFSALVQANYILKQILKHSPKIILTHISCDSLIPFGQKFISELSARICLFMYQFLFELYSKRELGNKFAKRRVRKKKSLLLSYFTPSQFVVKTKPEISLFHPCVSHVFFYPV